MQLTLPVSLPVNQTFDSFFEQGQKDVVDHLQSIVHHDTPRDVPFTLVCGPQGTGKSHLLFSLCHLADSVGKHCVYVNFEQYASFDTALLEGLEQQDIVCIDNIQALSGNKKWETALFDLLNRVLEKKSAGNRRHVILAAKELPQHTGFKLPDLVSRLQWGVTFKLKVPNDEQRRHIVALRAKQKGLELSDAACSFLLTHTNRHLPILMDVVEELDVLSLQAKKKITVPMLKKVLGE